MPSRFARKTEALKRCWRYRQDRGRDKWTWGELIRVTWYGALYKGDCEDFCARLVWKMKGSKKRAIRAIERGEYVFWWATTLGENGKTNHAVLECTATGEFSEVIFGKAVKKTDWSDKHLIGSIYLRKRISPHTVLSKLGEIKHPTGHDR